MKPDNNLGLSGYYYLKKTKFRKAFVEESGNAFYNIPQVVLELNKNNHTLSTINLTINFIFRIIISNLKNILLEQINLIK